MNKLKITFLFLLIILTSLLTVRNVIADAVIDNGLNYLKNNQDATGRINTGFSAPSQWSSIAFAANIIDISTIKSPSVSLQDFLINNIPSEPSAATDWETRILAIVATGGDPTNYGGVNYVSHLESFYSNNQIGDECSLNDDIFGLLAEISVGSSSSAQIKTDTLNFLITNQDPTDGGFGYSAPGCAWYSTSADMTGAAIQALVEAKNNGLVNQNLDSSINLAKNYLLNNQNSDGGYGYYGSSDTDTSGWVLMAFNVLDMKDSTPSANLKNWLTSQQSQSDGGFLAFDYGINSFVSNSTTTSQAIIGLSGKSWILKIFDPTTITPTPTPFASPEPKAEAGTPTTTPQPTTVPTLTPQPTSAPLASPEPKAEAGTLTPTPIIIFISSDQKILVPTVIPTSGQVLGTQTNEIKQANQQPNNKIPVSTIMFFGLGLFFGIIDFVRARI